MARNESTSGAEDLCSPANQVTPGPVPKTELEQFCEEVVASHLQVDLARLRSGISVTNDASSQIAGYATMDIMALVELIGQIVLKIIENCPERSSERLRSSIAAPTFWQRIRVKNIARDLFDSVPQRRWRGDSGAVCDCLIQCAGQVATARVARILDEIQADDNWLV